jgi:hypothetical protein
MSDQRPEHEDEALRAALQAEVDGVVAGSELLDRIRAGGARSTAPWRRRSPWIFAAAAAVAIGLVAVTALDDPSDDRQVDAVDDPTTSSTEPPDDALGPPLIVECSPGEDVNLAVYLQPTASETLITSVGDELAAAGFATRYVGREATYARFQELFADEEGLLETVTPDILPTSYLLHVDGPEDERAVRDAVEGDPGVYAILTVTCEEPSGADPQPTVVAIVREDGWLVTVDLETGAQTELYFAGDPNTAKGVEEGGPYFTDAVELSPDGEWIYFSTCCEPASGNTYRLPVDGGEPELFAVGSAPRVSPDGRFLATGAATFVIVTPIDKATGGPATYEVPCCTRSVAWSPDGTQLAAVLGTGAPGEGPEVLLFGWDGAALTPGDTGKPENPGSFVSWTPGGMLVISSGGPVDDDRGLAQDASYGWLLWVDEAGIVRAQAGHESSALDPVPGAPEALAADW